MRLASRDTAMGETILTLVREKNLSSFEMLFRWGNFSRFFFNRVLIRDTCTCYFRCSEFERFIVCLAVRSDCEWAECVRFSMVVSCLFIVLRYVIVQFIFDVIDNH